MKKNNSLQIERVTFEYVGTDKQFNEFLRSVIHDCVMSDPELWAQIMDETPLKRWATPHEIAQWAYFLTVINTFCTGQSILVDGGESINYHFVWKD